MPTIARDLVNALSELIAAQRELSSSMSEVAAQQRITNLIVRSQVSSDPVEKTRLLNQADALMNPPDQRI